MSKVGTLSNLKFGDIVKDRRGFYLIVMPNTISPNGLATFSRITSGCSQYLSSFNDDLTCKCDRNCDIVAVYKYSDLIDRICLYDIMRDIFTCKNPSEYKYGLVFNGIKPSWVRPEAKRMTVKEIEDILGYSVEIVSEKEVK